MGDEHSGTPGSKGFPFLTPMSIRPPSIRDFQFQLIGESAISRPQQNVQPPAFLPVALPGHLSSSPGLSTMQRLQSPARLSRRPLLDRLEQPQTQLMPEMRDATAPSQATYNPASQTTPCGVATSHSRLFHVPHEVPPLECNAPEPAEFQMQVDTNASGPTHQDAMDLDGGPPLPWRHPFDEPNEDTHSASVNKFRLADVFAETAKVMEEWKKVERPQMPLPKRRRLPQANSPTTRAATKAPLHRASPRTVAIPFNNRDADRSLWPSPNIVQTAVSNTAAAPVLEPPSQSSTVVERPVRGPLETGQCIQRLQELVRHGEAERRQRCNPLVQPCSSSLPKTGDIGTVSSLPPSSLGGPSARPHAPLAPLASTTSLMGDGDSLQSIEQLPKGQLKGQLSASEQTCRPATTTTSEQFTTPSICLTHLLPSNSGALVSPYNVPEAHSAVVIPTLKETQSSTAVATLPPTLPQKVKPEPITMKLEPSSPKLHAPALPITVAGVSEASTEATGRHSEVVPPATILYQPISAPSKDIPLTLPTGPLVNLPNFNVEAEPPSAPLEQRMRISASQSNTMTELRPATPAPATQLPSLGPSIPRAATPSQTEPTAMEVQMQMAQPEQTPFVPRTPPRRPDHTGPMYYSPAAPPLVSSYRRSASPPPRGQDYLRARTTPRGVTPQSLSPRWRSPGRTHPPLRSHPPRYDINARTNTDGHMHADSDGLDRRYLGRVDLRINSYRPHCADRPIGGLGRESYLPPYELESRDRTSSNSHGWIRDRYRPRSMETGPIPLAQHRRYPQSECHGYREPNGSGWPHPNHGDLEAPAAGHQAGSSRQHQPANENASLAGRSTCIRLDSSLPSYPSAGSGPHSAGPSTHSRSESPQVNSTVSPTNLVTQIAERAYASKRPREPETSLALEGPIHPTKSTSVTGRAPKRQKLDMTSSLRRTGGDLQTSVRVAPYRLGRITTHSLQDTLLGDMIPSTPQPTLADRMGGLKNSSSTRQSPPGPPRCPLISRFSSGPTLTSVSQSTLENPGEVSPPTTTRPLLDRFMSDEESSNQARLHRGRGRGGRGRGVPPTEPAALRHQPLQNRLSGGTHIKNSSLLERMDY